MDLLLILRDVIRPSREIDRIADIIADFNLRYGVLLSVLPVDENTLKTVEGPFWRNVRREGIAALTDKAALFKKARRYLASARLLPMPPITTRMAETASHLVDHVISRVPVGSPMGAHRPSRTFLVEEKGL